MRTLAALMVLALGTSSAFANDRGEIPDEPETKTVVITEKGSPFFRGVFASSLIASTALMSAAIYYNLSWRADIDNVRVAKPEDGSITQDDCGRSDIEDKNGIFTSMCAKRDRSRILGIAGLAMAPVVAATFYFGFVRISKREVKTIAIIPTVTPQVAGATLDIRW
jgi:hypothetical protein